MVNTINPTNVSKVVSTNLQKTVNTSGVENSGVNFKDMLLKAMESVNMEQQNAQRISELFAAGEIDDLHQVMIAQSKADVTLNLAVEVKNKLLESYKEIMRLQL